MKDSDSETQPGGILIVDDDAAIRFAMTDYFAAKGFRSMGVETRAEAETQLADGHYTIVITDLRLTPRDDAEGLEIVRLVAQRHPEVACIVLTAYGSPANQEKAVRYGASAFLDKPQPMGNVLDIVKALRTAMALKAVTSYAGTVCPPTTYSEQARPVKPDTPTTKEPSMDYQAPDEIVDLIWHDLAEQVARVRVAEMVKNVAAEIGEVKVATYLPLFVRRISVERLTSEMRSSTP